mgnify:CR=1 FL=1
MSSGMSDNFVALTNSTGFVAPLVSALKRKVSGYLSENPAASSVYVFQVAAVVLAVIEVVTTGFLLRV